MEHLWSWLGELLDGTILHRLWTLLQQQSYFPIWIFQGWIAGQRQIFPEQREIQSGHTKFMPILRDGYNAFFDSNQERSCLVEVSQGVPRLGLTIRCRKSEENYWSKLHTSLLWVNIASIRVDVNLAVNPLQDHFVKGSAVENPLERDRIWLCEKDIIKRILINLHSVGSNIGSIGSIPVGENWKFQSPAFGTIFPHNG